MTFEEYTELKKEIQLNGVGSINFAELAAKVNQNTLELEKNIDIVIRDLEMEKKAKTFNRFKYRL